MSARVVTLEIDCMAAARRALATPDGVYTLSAFEVLALAACTVRESTGVMPELPVVAEPPASPLVTAVERFLSADRFAFDDALNALRSQFEKDFPHGSAENPRG